MNVNRSGNLLFWVGLTIAFLLSFRAYAANLTPGLNSDHAVQILMAADLKLPEDLYYWGQDRLGSIVPILAHLLLKVLPLSAAQVVSYVQYFFLLVGFFSIANLFKKKLSRLIFAIAWFLPLHSFDALLQIAQPYAAQLAFLGMAIAPTNQLFEQPTLGVIQRRVRVSFITVSLFASLWISDLSIVPLVLFASMSIWSTYRGLAGESVKTKLQNVRAIAPEICLVGLTSLAGFLFIVYAKSHATAKLNYIAFNQFGQTLEVLVQLTRSFANTLLFRADNLFLSIQAVLSILLIFCLVLIGLQKIWRSDKSQQVSSDAQPYGVPSPNWLTFFLLNAVISLILLVLSHWVYINQVSLRYFVPVYVFGWVAVLLVVESLQGVIEKAAEKAIAFLLILIVLATSLSLPSFVYALEPPESKITQLQAMQSLGKAGFIGEYWNSYILCSANPELFHCTPLDPRGKAVCSPRRRWRLRIGGVRCRRCVVDVLASRQVYLVKENWLESFPNRTEQFGLCLRRTGEPLQIAGYTLAAYRVLPKR